MKLLTIKEFNRSLFFAVLLTFFIMFSLAFLSAYFRLDKAVTIKINDFGEANGEFIMLLLSIFIVLNQLEVILDAAVFEKGD